MVGANNNKQLGANNKLMVVYIYIQANQHMVGANYH
jgi:hypothetical protein